MTDLSNPWETYRTPVADGDPHFVEGCEPDLYIPDMMDVSADNIASLNARHVLIDFDGTLAANGNIPPVTEEMYSHIAMLAADPRFETFSFATNNRASYMKSIAARIGECVGLFQPNETKNGEIGKFHPGFYRRILFELDIWDTPDEAVMIGDSPRYDIVAAQNYGIKTILVNRMEKRMAANLAQRLEAIREARRTVEADEV